MRGPERGFEGRVKSPQLGRFCIAKTLLDLFDEVSNQANRSIKRYGSWQVAIVTEKEIVEKRASGDKRQMKCAIARLSCLFIFFSPSTHASLTHLYYQPEMCIYSVF
jgi:hypothetical protein